MYMRKSIRDLATTEAEQLKINKELLELEKEKLYSRFLAEDKKRSSYLAF